MHVGGTCFKQLSSMLLLCELWHHPVGTTFLSCLLHASRVLDAGSCLNVNVVCRSHCNSSLPLFKKVRGRTDNPYLRYTAPHLLLLICGEVLCSTCGFSTAQNQQFCCHHHPLQLRLIQSSSLNGIHPTIVYGVFPHLSLIHI